MGNPLNAGLEKMPGQELERDPAMMRKMKQMKGVDSLLRWNKDIDHPEVILETVTNKDTATINKKTELLIG